MKPSRQIFALAAFVIGTELVGGLGAVFTSAAIPTWYVGLVKPVLNPPAWVFGPVWTALYALMGISAFLVWRKGKGTRMERAALGIFVLQLLLNFLWSILFFGMRNPGAAMMDIVALWFAILATILAFGRVSKPAAWLLVPYLAWVSFAAYLNLALWTLN